MALSYDDANTGLFTHLGKLVKYYNVADANGGTGVLDVELQAILDKFQLGNQDVAADGLPSAYEDFRSAFVARKSQLGRYALRRLQDATTVLAEINANNADKDEIFQKLITRMVLDSETINASTPSIGTVTAGSANVGNGTILVTGVLDGYTSPGANANGAYLPHLKYKGVTSELLPLADESIWEVTADSFTDGLTEGNETIRWNGRPRNVAHGISSLTRGAGDVGSVPPLHSNSLLSNLDFETFTSTNTPSSPWVIVTGTAGTHIFAETSGANIYHGTKSLKLTGDGALAAIQLTQAPSISSLKANKGYCLSARIKASATIAAGDLTISFTGTGYSASSSEKIEIAAASLPTSYTLHHFFINLPAVIPSDFKLSILWNGTPTNTKNLWLDDLAFGPVTYGSGFGVAAVRGSTPFVRGDRWTSALSCSGGVFQAFMRDVFGYQLPSDAAAGETITDSLAT